MNEETVTLRQYIESLFAEKDKRYEQKFNDTKIAVDAALIAADKAVAAALAGQKEAVTKAEVAAEKRFESVNEFRAVLVNQQSTLLPRSEFSISIKSLEEKIEMLEKTNSANLGQRVGTSQGWGYAIGGIGLVAALVAILSRFIQ